MPNTTIIFSVYPILSKSFRDVNCFYFYLFRYAIMRCTRSVCTLHSVRCFPFDLYDFFCLSPFACSIHSTSSFFCKNERSTTRHLAHTTYQQQVCANERRRRRRKKMPCQNYCNYINRITKLLNYSIIS